MDEKDYKAMNEESKPQLKQTAVDYLAEKYNYITWMRNRDEISAGTADEWRAKFLKEAKEMENEQMQNIIDAYITGRLKDKNIKYGIEYYNKLDEYIDEGEEYYNKTYNNETI